MDEAALCDRVALIQTGSIMSIDTPGQIVKSFGKTLWGVRSENMLHLLNDLNSFDEVDRAYPSGIYHHVIMNDGGNKELLQQYLISKYPDVEIIEIEPDIEDCFMQLMQN